MTQDIRIVLADDHPLMRQGLKQVIEIEPSLTIVGEAGNGSEALAMIEALTPAVAILDVDMPHQDGFQVARALLAKRNPAAIIFLTIHSEEQMFHAALDLGAKGYVLKDSAIDDIVTAIHEVVAAAPLPVCRCRPISRAGRGRTPLQTDCSSACGSSHRPSTGS